MIREINPSGIIGTFAGTLEPGYSGDGGPASAAQFYYPKGIAMDSAGNLYVADMGNSVIRKISSNGTVTTVAGNGIPGFFGDGAAATSAELSFADAVAVDNSGNLYIADIGNQRIREVFANGTITTIAGNGAPGYSGDGGVATQAELYDPAALFVVSCLKTVCNGLTNGTVYVADEDNNVIRMLKPAAPLTGASVFETRPDRP